MFTIPDFRLFLTRRHEQGQSLVEFALIVPIFVLVLFAIVDGGRAIYAFSTINNAAREAARVAIVDQTLSHIQAEGQAQSVALGIPSSDVTVVYREYDDSADCPSGQTDPSVGCLAAVTVAYTFTAVTPVVSQLMGSIDMTGRSFFPIEAACVEPPAAKCPKGD
jgi:Flp pilus assembly protein TadG